MKQRSFAIDPKILELLEKSSSDAKVSNNTMLNSILRKFFGLPSKEEEVLSKMFSVKVERAKTVHEIDHSNYVPVPNTDLKVVGGRREILPLHKK